VSQLNRYISKAIAEVRGTASGRRKKKTGSSLKCVGSSARYVEKV
jgi:hypothetical protein